LNSKEKAPELSFRGFVLLVGRARFELATNRLKEVQLAQTGR